MTGDRPRDAHARRHGGTRRRAILDEVERAVVGKRPVLELVLAGLLADGHVLLDDLPGVAKTLMARSLATVTGLAFSRVQFTPDLLPVRHHGRRRARPGQRALRVPARARCSPTSCSPTR